MPIDFSTLVLNPCMNTFADDITYIPAVEPQFAARGVFDEAYEELVVIDGQPVTTRMPVLGIRLSEYAVAPVQNDQLIIGVKRYIVREVRIDSHGGAKLMLNRIITEPDDAL